jgi:hypothetical protein
MNAPTPAMTTDTAHILAARLLYQGELAERMQGACKKVRYQ